MNILNLIYIIWILSEIVLTRFARSGKSDMAGADKKTHLTIWLSIVAAVTAAVYIAFLIHLPVFANEKLRLIGFAVIAAGIIFRFVAIRQLGRFFTVDVTIREDHQLMLSGLYKYLRHPSYSGSLLSFIGLGLSINNWLSLVIVFVPVLLTFIIRIRQEEKVLTEQFGKQYLDYMSHTKRLIPFIY
jgi:protein-S-isoprenylcysteine O-methyltransferase Ste14